MASGMGSRGNACEFCVRDGPGRKFVMGTSEVAIRLVMTSILLLTIFWISAFVHCLTNRRLRDTEKLTWVLAIFFLNVIGAAIYFLVVRNPRH
jgi:uncharacterized membrane protein YhaH (DUF805 family)